MALAIASDWERESPLGVGFDLCGSFGEEESGPGSGKRVNSRS